MTHIGQKKWAFITEYLDNITDVILRRTNLTTTLYFDVNVNCSCAKFVAFEGAATIALVGGKFLT